MDSGRSQAFLLFLRITSNLVRLYFLCFFLLLISLFCPFVVFFFFGFFLRFILSESDELELEDVSDSEILLDDELDVKELGNDDELRYFRF